MKNRSPKDQPASKQERGQSLVEFAFSAVFLLILLTGLVDVSRALFTYMAMRDAAQEGALFGSTDPENLTQIRARVKNSSDLVRGLSVPDGDITVTYKSPYGQTFTTSDRDPCMGDNLIVRMTLPNFQLTMPFLGTLVGSQTVPITVTVTDTVLRPRCP